MEQKINISVIGCGHWGPNHIRVFNTLPGSRVVSIADKDNTRLEKIKAQFPGVRALEDPAKMLQDPSVDAVVIATPARTHYALVKEALDNGKHVLCEKPLCISGSESLELAELAEKKGLVLAVGYVFLYNPGILKLRDIISSGELGNLHYISLSRTNLGPIRHDVNVVYDLMTHDISILSFLLNAQPVSVAALGGSYLQGGIEDVSFASLSFENKVIANITCSWLDPRKVRQMTVVGDKKMALWDDLNMAAPVTIYDKGVIKEPYYSDYAEFLRLGIRENGSHTPAVAPSEPLKEQDADFLRHITAKTQPYNSARFDASVVRVLESVNESIRAKGEAVHL